MRVTKAIREYIEQEVGKRFKEPTAIERDCKERTEAFNEELEAIRKAMNEQVLALIKKREMINMRSSDELVAISTYGISALNQREANQARHERICARDAAIQNIIVTLELGGNKADLDRLLAEL